MRFIIGNIVIIYMILVRKIMCLIYDMRLAALCRNPYDVSSIEPDPS